MKWWLIFNNKITENNLESVHTKRYIVTSLFADSLLCSACHELANGAVSSACAHLFCINCAKAIIDKDKNAKCPSCYKTFAPFSASLHEQIGVQMCDVVCRTCSFQGKFAEWLSHSCDDFIGA